MAVPESISMASYYLALKYISNGLSEPDEKTVEFERNYYEHKYKLSEISEELPLCVVVLTHNNV